MPAFGSGDNGQERRHDWIALQLELVALNDLAAAKEFYYSEPAVTWLEGWDETALTETDVTPLLSLMAGLDVPTEGSVLFQSVSTADVDLERYRRERVSVIYQDFRLFPLLTAAENVMYPMELRGMKPAAAKKRAAELIGKVGLPETALDRFPAMLSGGEQQRVAIARALGT